MKILMLVLNTFENDSRVERTAKTLAEVGHEVTLLCLYRDGLPKHEFKDGYKVIRLHLPPPIVEETSIQERLLFLRPRHPVIYYSAFAILTLLWSIKKAIKITNRSLKRAFKLIRSIYRRLMRYARELVGHLRDAVVSVLQWYREVTPNLKQYLITHFPILFRKTARLSFEKRRRRYQQFAERALSFADSTLPDVVHAHDFNCLLAAEQIYKGLSIPYIYDSHELWIDRNRPNIIAPREEIEWEKRKEGDAIKTATASITVCDSIADYLKDHYQVEKPLVIRNTPFYCRPELNPEKSVRKSLGLSDTDFVAVYVGKVAANRGIIDIIKAVPLTEPSVKVVLLGPVDKRFEKVARNLVAKLHLENRVFWHAPVPSQEIPIWIADCNASLTTMNQVCLSYIYTLPNKLFESVQAGLPIIGPDSPEIIRIIEKYNCGVTYRDGNHKDLARQINFFLTNPDVVNKFKLGARTAAQELCWENEKDKLLALYQDLFTNREVLQKQVGAKN